MKDYKKLTSEQDFNCRECVDGECQKPDIFCPYRCECERYNRLYNLEDKIERGEIDYVAEKDKEIARLTAENDKLRARLENAVELPCKVGDTVYWLFGTMIYEYKVQGFSFNTNDRFGLRLILGEIEPSVMYYEDKKLFFDRTKAEAKLKEIGGGENENK